MEQWSLRCSMNKGFCKIAWGKLLNIFLEMYTSHQHGKGSEKICSKENLSFLNCFDYAAFVHV